MATVNSWSASVISRMKNLFDKGMSTSEIGKRLGFSKNAIVGKINRLGWNAPKKKAAAAGQRPKAAHKPKKAALKPQPKKKPAPKKIHKPTPTEARQSKKNIERVILHSAQLMALRPDQCRWPLGDPDSDNFRFCGEKCFTGKPYCFEHCKHAYQFTTPPKKK